MKRCQSVEMKEDSHRNEKKVLITMSIFSHRSENFFLIVMRMFEN